ncbi:uncharacterized protein LOC123018074 isoform X2 [Varanus komodoensis]|nr:uncharacterized protein LOC123018074 isoform X2 [Varanus komodoensis]
MSREQSWHPLQERRSLRGLQPESLDSEDSQTNRHKPTYLEPWIVNLLLEYDKTETREDGQLGHVLKVLNEARAVNHNKHGPAAVMYIADGSHYIQVLVTPKAAEMTKFSLPQSGFSSIVGQFIVLQNYRVCFKGAAKVEDCEFYLTLECFRVMPMKRQKTRPKDCNQEPSVLQKIKQLWQKGFAMQLWPSSEQPSVSEILREIKQDQLSTLKQSVEDCLSLLDPSKLDSEQMAVYPDTKWQRERREAKLQRDTFTVPAKLLVISAENEAALSKSYTPKTSQAVHDTGESSQDDDQSTASFFSAESESLDVSLENPWDIFPGMTLTSSSDTSGTLPGLPAPQQVLLATTAEEEEAPCFSSPTTEFPEPRAHTSLCNSEQADLVETASPTLLPSHNHVSLKESVSQESIELNTTYHASKAADTDESTPCDTSLKNSHSHTATCLLSPVCPPSRSDCSLASLSENMKEDHLTHLQRDKMVLRNAGEKCLDRGRKCVAAKRKQMMPDEEETTETFSSPEHPSTRAFAKAHELESKLLTTCKSPLKFVSTPKKSRIETIQQHPASAQFRCTETFLEKGREQRVADITPRRPGQHRGQQQHVKRAPFHIKYKRPTPELCSQVRSTRISRAMLGWARWIFSNTQKQ